MDQEDTDKMDFIEDVVHEPFYLIPISFPILFRSYAKGRLPLFMYAKLSLLKLHLIRQSKNLRAPDGDPISRPAMDLRNLSYYSSFEIMRKDV
ncbi:hypothetical protein I312_102688 [Cryptococcus bacillisporus CA1280]|uniref:uncharacterized protein n=1 Tax=Cryptococcus bacillisporus CA1280 TaxID=1296109 RepID=UPI0033661AC3